MYKASWRSRVNHVQVYLPHSKDYQDFGITERNQGMNHELIYKYHVQPSGHVDTDETTQKSLSKLTKAFFH